MYFVETLLLFLASNFVGFSDTSPQLGRLRNYENVNSRYFPNFPEFIEEITQQIKKGVGNVRDKLPWVSSLVPADPSQENGRQFQQWQVALLLPPSSEESKTPNLTPGSNVKQLPIPVNPIDVPQFPPLIPNGTVPFPGMQSEDGVSNLALPLAPSNDEDKDDLLGGLNLNDVSQKPIKLENNLPITENLKQSCQRARGQYPSPRSCNRFLNCWDEAVVEQDCPEGLFFSSQGYCDYPQNVDCSRRPILLREQKCSQPYATFRDQLNCSRFSICVSGIPIKFECPDALKYNQELGICDYPYRVACTDRLTAAFDVNLDGVSAAVGAGSKAFMRAYNDNTDNWQSLTAMENETLQILPGLIDTGVRCFGDSIQSTQGSCNSVAICRDGYSQIVNCPQGTGFDSRAMKCIFEKAAQC